MPGGQSGGAQGFGRFYRNASLTITDTETTIGFDADSTLAGDPIQVTRDSGDIKSSIGGVGVATLQMHMVGSPSAKTVTMRCYHIHPELGSILVAETHKDVPVSATPLTFECIAYFGLVVDSKVRFTAQLGSGSLDIQVGGENETHMALVIG